MQEQWHQYYSGGLYRCCIATLGATVFREAPKRGELLTCLHCKKETMQWTGIAWEWVGCEPQHPHDCEDSECERCEAHREDPKSSLVDTRPLTYKVYWDNKCQCELWRGTDENLKTLDFDIFGGGQYNIYTCLTDWRITKVISRKPMDGGGLSELQMVIEQDVGAPIDITPGDLAYMNKEN